MSSQRCREEQDRVHGQGTIECEKGASCFNQVLILSFNNIILLKHISISLLSNSQWGQKRLKQYRVDKCSQALFMHIFLELPNQFWIFAKKRWKIGETLEQFPLKINKWQWEKLSIKSTKYW